MPRTSFGKPRRRVINFRLSDEEYQHLKAACERSGSHCLSDFARAAVLRRAETEISTDGNVHSRLLHLDRRIEDLGAQVHQLIKMMDPASKASAAKG